MLTNIAAGLLVGLITACGGAFKDAPYEGFRWGTFPRSIVAGLVAGVLSSALTDGFLLAFCVSGYLERALVEGYKILRQKKPGKFLTAADQQYLQDIVANREHQPPPSGTLLSYVVGKFQGA